VQVHGVNSFRGSGSEQWQLQWPETVAAAVDSDSVQRACEHNPDHPLGLSSRQVMARTSSKVASTVAVPGPSTTPA
jgi:hypothetical protein